jgi:hypothetical protein
MQHNVMDSIKAAGLMIPYYWGACNDPAIHSSAFALRLLSPGKDAGNPVPAISAALA